MVFGDSIRQQRNTVVQNMHVDVVISFKYIGVVFTKNRGFLAAKQHSIEQARKALFSLYTKIRNICLPVDSQLILFDNSGVPILLYAYEVWGYSDLYLIDKVHTDIMKHNYT